MAKYKTSNSYNNFKSTNSYDCEDCLESFGSGGTLLGKKSDQNFTSISKIANYDKNNITELLARLITDKRYEEEEEFISIARKKTNYPKRLDEHHIQTYDDSDQNDFYMSDQQERTTRDEDFSRDNTSISDRMFNKQYIKHF
jgi:hypothetical protein